jgi:putative membrane protein
VIDAFEATPFTARMALHMLLVVGVAPAVAAALAGGRFDPVRRWPRWFSPIAASLVEFVVVWTWHAPFLHIATRHRTSMLVAEQTVFVVTALYLWLAIVGGDAPGRALRRSAGIIALVLTFGHMTMLGVLLALSPRDLYAHGLDASMDQKLGGALMIVASTLGYLGAAVWLSSALITDRVSQRRL